MVDRSLETLDTMYCPNRGLSALYLLIISNREVRYRNEKRIKDLIKVYFFTLETNKT